LFAFDSNAPDFASRATTPSAAVWPQLITMPLGFSIVSFIGIIVSSSSKEIFGEFIWDPIDLLGRFLDGHPSSATRFGVCFSKAVGKAQKLMYSISQVWFIAFAFIIAQLGTNIRYSSRFISF
jgi:nucleobase:cation symporter-1, NCS1 family